MKFPLIITTIFYLLSHTTFSQDIMRKELDSIDNLLKHHKKEDTLFVNLRVAYLSRFFLLNPSDTTLISFTQKTLKVSKRLKYDKGVMLSYINLGTLNSRQKSDPYTAIDYYQKALSIIDTDEKLYRYKHNINIELGLIYYEQQDYKKAIKHYKESIVIGGSNLSTSYSTLGNIYGSINKGDSSIYYYDKAIAIDEKNQSYLHLANNLSNKALVLNGMGEKNKAKEVIDQSIKLTEQYQFDYIKGTVYFNAATIYKDLGELEVAEKYISLAINHKTGLNDLFSRKGLWGTLSEIHETKGEYKEALEAYKKYHELSDSLTNEDRKSEITRKFMQYESEKKESLATSEINRQKIIKNSIISISLILLLSGIFMFIGFRKRQKIKSEQKELLLRSKIADTEHKALRAQMNPHFIFNSLNSIGDYIHKNDLKSADYYLAKFAKLMRGILENSELKEISLTEEIKTMELYMQLESSRLQNKLSYEIKIDEGINPETIMIPPLIIQPFIENSIWHGISPKEGGGKVIIEVKKENRLLKITVEDNGIGRKSTGEYKKSYGVKLTNDRIELLEFAEAGVVITDLEQGTRVEIKLPFIEES